MLHALALTLLALAPGSLPRGAVYTLPAPHAAPLLMRSGGTPPAAPNSVSRQLRSLGTTLATALLLVVPRGAARAVPAEQIAQPEATAVSRSATCDHGRRARQPAFLGYQKKELRPTYLASPPSGGGVDLDTVLPKKYAQRFTDRDFIFSEKLTQKSELEEELEELETYKEASKGSRALQTVATTGGAVGLIYLSVKGLTAVERWIKEQELKDIEEERELTGTYISVDASDVDSAIDPTTGKNLTISRAKSTKKSDEEDDSPKEAPWLLRVLGLGDTVASDDDNFWEPVAPSQGPSGKPKGGGSGAEGGDDVDDSEEDDDDDDDSEGLDTLGDLLG